MDVTELVPADVGDATAFLANVVEPCRPVVIRGLCRDWPATRAAATTPAALLALIGELDTGRTAEAFVGEPAIAGRYFYADELAGFNFARESMTVVEALDRIIATADVPGASTLYMGSLPTEPFLPGFAGANRANVVPPTVAPRIWLGHASVVSCHHDNLDNLACVVAGRRRFTLFPPEAIGDLYVGPIDHTMAGQPVSLAVGSPRDDPRFPRFEAVRDEAITVDLAAGDAIYVPKLWWHQVEATAPLNMLVNYWWDAVGAGPDSPYTAMLLAMAAIAERPAGERAAWRAFFDHYVFRPERHPLDHLPESHHGILGRGQHGRLRAMVMRMLRGG